MEEAISFRLALDTLGPSKMTTQTLLGKPLSLRRNPFLPKI